MNPGDPIVLNNYGELIVGRLIKLTPKTAVIRVPAYGIGWYERKTKRSWVSPASPQWVARLMDMEREQAAAAAIRAVTGEGAGNG